jgi:hypothetical protein
MQLQELAAVASLGADLVRSVNGDSSENGVIALPIHDGVLGKTTRQ